MCGGDGEARRRRIHKETSLSRKDWTPVHVLHKVSGDKRMGDGVSQRDFKHLNHIINIWASA